MKVRSAILRRSGVAKPYAQSRPIEISDVELSGPAEDEVLVKIAAAGVCHSDLSAINGDRPRPPPE
jgi:alcohol dehydrogenase